MEITRRSVRGVTVLDLTGRLIVSPGEVEIAPLRTAIGELMTAGCVDVAINLAGLTHLDARGLGELVLAMKTARLHGGRLRLVAPSARVARMLVVTRLDTVFERCDSEAQLRACALPRSSVSSGGQAHLDMTAYA
jgi:anti-sigma B factor antagonist